MAAEMLPVYTLHVAAADGDVRACRWLVEDLGFPVDALSPFGDTPLVLAAKHDRTKTAAYLLERGADPRLPDSHSETPLHWAARKGDHELAMLLLQRGADADAMNPRGTPLDAAAFGAHPKVVQVLLNTGGANPNIAVNHVYTPLVWTLVASSMGCIAGRSLECMKLLIKAHADVNIGGFNGMTPLFLACSLSGSMTFVKCLLDAGADPNVMDELGRLPIEVAAADAETEFIEALFPVTRRPPTMLDWSVAGIVRHVNSAAYKERVIKDSCIKRDQMKEQGQSAFNRKDYEAAILFYNLAMKFDCTATGTGTSTDATLYSNRSICWLRLGLGEVALSDAQECTKMRPDWAKGYYRQGMAFSLLQDYASAYDAFLKASKLDPKSTEIKQAIRDVSARRSVS